MKNFPKQTLSLKEKEKDDYQWAKDTIDSLLLDYVDTGDVVNAARSDYDRMLSNYQLYNNLINQEDLRRECDPLGIEVGQYKDEIQPYNKTNNKIQVLLGEELRRPFNYKVVLTNPEGIRSKLAFRDKMLRNYVYSKISEVLEQYQLQFEHEDYDPQEIIDPKDLNQYMSTSYLHSKEILASKLLQYLVKLLNIIDLKNDAFKHGLISGAEFVYVGKINDEPIVKPLNSLGAFYYKSPETKFIQYGLAAGYRTFMTSGDVLDNFGAWLSEEDIKRIDEGASGANYGRADGINRDMKYFHDEYVYDRYLTGSMQESSYGGDYETLNQWLVCHVEWKSQKRVGFIHYMNEYGDKEVDIVDENFEVPEHAKKVTKKKRNYVETYYTWIDDVTGVPYALNWGYIPEVWEGYRIGQDIYCMIGPKEHQFRTVDNPYTVKLGYHGVVYNAMNAESVSLMDRMKPFQYLYFIVMHKLKKLIAQDSGKIFHFDTTMVDPTIGLEKTLYYLKNLNIDFFNPLQNADEPGWAQRGKVHGSTDMSVAQQVINYVNILAALDQQISDVAGVTRQREGQAAPNEAVTNAQTNLQMSSVVTEIYFQPHNKVWESIFNSLIEVAQVCYKNRSVTRQFVLDDLSIATLELTPDSLSNSSFGIFATNSPKEQFIFDTMQQWGQALVQNDKATFSDLITMLSTTSSEDLKMQIRKSEEAAQQRIQQEQQMQIQAQQQMQQAEQNYNFEYQMREHEHELRLKEIETFRYLQDQDINNNQIPDQFEIDKFRSQAKQQDRRLDLEEAKLKAAKEKNKVDAELKKEDLKIKAQAKKTQK